MAIISTKPSMNYGIWGSNGNITVPTSEKVEQGHIVEKPKAEIVNWIENRQDSFLQYINQRGIPTWDSTTEYPSSAYVVRSGILYKALSQNQDKDPSTNTAIWVVAFTQYSDYLNLYNDVQAIKNDEGYLNLYVSKANPVMTGEAKGVSYLDTTGVSGLTFSGTSPQVKKNGVVIGTFIGDESPTDLVTMEKLKEYLQFYKVGDLYLTTSTGNPSTILGYGTWERFGEGRAIVSASSASSSNPDWTKVVTGTNGVYTNTVTFPMDNWSQQATEINTSVQGRIVVGTGRTELSETLESLTQPISNQTQSLNNVQPSVVVNVWRRTA